MSYERKVSEVVEGAEKLDEEGLFVYLDMLVQRGFLTKKGNTYSPTDAFRKMFFQHAIEVLKEISQGAKLTKDFLFGDFLLNVSLRLAFEIIVGKTPINENELEYANWKEIGGLTRAVHSFFSAYTMKELKEMSKKIKELLKEER